MPERCDKEIQCGFLLMEQTAGDSITPAMAPSILCCLAGTVANDCRIDPIARKLTEMCRTFLRDDIPPFQSCEESFASQLNLLLQIRCLALCAPKQTEDSVGPAETELRGLSKEMNMLQFIACARTPLHKPAFLTGDIFDQTFHIPAQLTIVRGGKPNFEAGTLWVSESKTYAEADAFLPLMRKDGQIVVFVLQHKLSKSTNEDTTVTPLSCDMVADAVVKTCTHHHELLREFIESKRFGFIVAAFRDFSDPTKKGSTAYSDALRRNINQKLKNNKNLSSAQLKLIKSLTASVAANLCVLSREQLKRLFTPTLCGRAGLVPTAIPPQRPGSNLSATASSPSSSFFSSPASSSKH